MCRAREESQSAGPNRNNWLLGVVRRVTAAGTGESAGGVIVEKFGVILGGKSTSGAKLLEMLVTPDQWDCQLIEKEKRDALSSWRAQSRLACSAPD